jgi:hypothetical protein
MTPERADALLRAVTLIREDLPFVAMVIDALLPAEAPFTMTAEKGLAKVFEVASVYLTKQGDEARDEIRKRVENAWGADMGGATVTVE